MAVHDLANLHPSRVPLMEVDYHLLTPALLPGLVYGEVGGLATRRALMDLSILSPLEPTYPSSTGIFLFFPSYPAGCISIVRFLAAPLTS
ncbi:hypothetical protein [Pasteuria penetrans]|uniref:hypothetical protein n=1 Tax=Pasteuria penetrans TaxID=86005 RepID=UPI0011EEDD72|nr:hypothetical protein [Pasteuria penetrans]